MFGELCHTGKVLPGVLHKISPCFGFCDNLRTHFYIDDLKEYCELASKTANEQKEDFTGPLGNDVFQCSPMPWVTYAHISHTNSGKKDNATSLFDWGKYYEKDGKVMIPISVQAHHSFVDGLHIGQFVEQLQKFLNEC